LKDCRRGWARGGRARPRQSWGKSNAGIEPKGLLCCFGGQRRVETHGEDVAARRAPKLIAERELRDVGLALSVDGAADGLVRASGAIAGARLHDMSVSEHQAQVDRVRGGARTASGCTWPWRPDVVGHPPDSPTDTADDQQPGHDQTTDQEPDPASSSHACRLHHAVMSNGHRDRNGRL